MNKSQIAARLTECFLAVFPGLSSEQVPDAVAGATEGWDSVGAVTLAAVIEEEFGLTIGPEDLPHLVSYRVLHDWLTSHVA